MAAADERDDHGRMSAVPSGLNRWLPPGGGAREHIAQHGGHRGGVLAGLTTP
jgi:hypothetical protein